MAAASGGGFNLFYTRYRRRNFGMGMLVLRGSSPHHLSHVSLFGALRRIFAPMLALLMLGAAFQNSCR